MHLVQVGQIMQMCESSLAAVQASRHNIMKADSSAMLCRSGQYNSHALGGNTAPAGTGGQGCSDHHPPALFPPVPDAGQAAPVVRRVSHAFYAV